MVASLKEMIAQKEALEQQIDQKRNQDRAEAIAQVRALMEEYGLGPADLSIKAVTKSKSGKTGKVAAKYRDTATGESWSGRGLQPRWLKAALAAGRKITEFAV